MQNKVLLIGDGICDINRFGKVTRLCPEGPVPVWVPVSQEKHQGGAYLVDANLQALGVNVTADIRSYSEKTRLWSNNHLLLREDQDSLTVSATPLPPIKNYDAVVVSDYNKGGLDKKTIQQILKSSACPVFVDTKRPDPELYQDCFAIFPNAAEASHICYDGIYQHVVRKDGANGCYVDGTPVPTTAVQAHDVTGAGDVFLAAFVAEYLKSSDLIKAAQFANRAAAISVQHIGSYVLTAKDIQGLK